MEIVTNIILSFIATACFGVIFNAPIKALPWCGFVGSIGWTFTQVLAGLGLNEVHYSLIGAFAVSIVAHVFARKFRMPMIVFSVSGILPLVPGGIAYNAMRSIIENDYLAGMEGGMRAFMISGALAMGLIFAEVMMQLVYKSFVKGRTSIQSFVKTKKQSNNKVKRM